MSEVAGYIERKTMLYKTGVEYGDYTMNFVLGCSHGCLFPCYAFLQKKRFGQIKDYADWCSPRLVSNTLELLDNEIPRLKGKIVSVQLCFTTDPFMYGCQEIADMAIASIKKLNAAGIKCIVLTKGILPISLGEFSDRNEYGITLISLNEEYRKNMEPGAAPYKDRLAVSFVDRIIFGRTNYNKTASSYEGHRAFYNKCAAEVISFCEEHGIQYHIKEKTITEE